MRRIVRTTAVTTSATTATSAGAFSGRPAPFRAKEIDIVQFRQPVGQSAVLVNIGDQYRTTLFALCESKGGALHPV